MQIKDKVIAITGGGRGIGRAMAVAFADKGGHVALLDLNPADLEETRSLCAAKGVRASTHVTNVTSEQDVGSSLDAVVREFGRLDVMVNNAGITKDGFFHKMSQEQWDEVIRVDLSSLYYMTRPIYEGMRNRGFGRVINITSINGQKGQAGQVNYSAAKAGMIGFTKALAQEGAMKGVTVNCVAPGYVDTDMVAAVPEEVLKKIIATIPVGRLGKAEEIASMVAFLASDQAAFITGATMTVNGAQYIAG